MIREPLAGMRAVVPVSRGLAVALASPDSTMCGLLRAAETSDEVWGPPLAVNLPSLTVTVGEMAAALERIAGHEAAARLEWVPDATVERVVGSWPAHFDWGRARELGMSADADFDDIVRAHQREAEFPRTPDSSA
ncbi:hypothetical protein ABLE91_27060 [Aquabacter sp. CN5-332]|uniref:hypothetical protein n=1 Tax=Aquabacter sp. CN5-332 TaxID=3156608 RepID=UPI0032B583B7